jgi:hypothetical protein
MSCWSSSGVGISPRTVSKYCRSGRQLRRSALVHVPEEPCKGDSCVRLLRGCHARRLMLYVFVVIEHGHRRLAHVNVTTNPER